MENERLPSRLKGVQSVRTGGAILEALSEAGGPAQLKTLALASNMSAAKAHRYLHSFIEIGLVTQDEASGRYDLGPLALKLGLAAIRKFDVVRYACEELPALRDQLNETVAILVWGGKGPTVMRTAESKHEVTMTMRVGIVLPILASGSGRIFASYLPREVLREQIRADIAAAVRDNDPHLPHSWDAFEAMAQGIRSRRLCRVSDEFLPGVGALTAPIFGVDGTIAAVVVAFGRAQTFNASYEGDVAKALLTFSDRVSKGLPRTQIEPGQHETYLAAQ